MFLLKVLGNVLLCGLAIFIGTSFWVYSGVLAATGAGHTLTYSSVDNGEIRYGGSTKYSTNRTHANSQWNSLSSVDILPDSATAIQDLTYMDVYSTETFSGRYTHNLIGADTIKFNDRIMQDRTSTWNNKTATHELGHAVGLDDHEGSSWSGIIMYNTSSEVQKLQAHDKEDYNDRW